MKNKQHKIFLNITKEIAKLSHCERIHVAAIAVKNRRVLYTGINGTPSGYINCDTYFKNKYQEFENPSLTYQQWKETKEFHRIHHEWSLVHEIHAEENLLKGLSYLGVPTDDIIVYLTHQPCNECIKKLITFGIKQIIYLESYSRSSIESIEFAKNCGTIIQQYQEELEDDGN